MAHHEGRDEKDYRYDSNGYDRHGIDRDGWSREDNATVKIAEQCANVAFGPLGGLAVKGYFKVLKKLDANDRGS